MSRNQLRSASLFLTCCWMATIFYLSSLHSIDIDLGFSAQDKLFHMAAYGVLGIFILGSMPLDDLGYNFNQVALATFVATLYGITDEWHQAYVPGRSSDPLDVVADCIGALLATLLARALIRRLRRATAQAT